ncbi:MAG: hypothetical protein NUW01_14105 [Gemmatimonadaceae bacterium]|nr:hypothetical protein [Gemmatimonadaceae bacterium]
MSTEDEQKANSAANPDGAAAGAGSASAEDQKGQEGADQQKAPETVSREAYSALQSKADKATADARRAREEADRAVEAAERAKREAVLAALKPEERDAAIRNFDLEARERRLQTAEREQDELAKTLTVKTLAMDNGLTPVQRTELEAIDDVNEMRARAAEMKSERLQAELDAAKNGKPAVKVGEEQKSAPKGMRGDPAGSGQGGAAGAYDASKFKGTGDIAGAMRAKREAGEVVYEKIPTGRR